MSAAACTELSQTLSSLPALKCLNLNHCGLRPETCNEFFPAFTALRRLEDLRLEACTFSQESACSLGAVIADSVTSIKSMSFASSTLGHSSAAGAACSNAGVIIYLPR